MFLSLRVLDTYPVKYGLLLSVSGTAMSGRILVVLQKAFSVAFFGVVVTRSNDGLLLFCEGGGAQPGNVMTSCFNVITLVDFYFFVRFCWLLARLRFTIVGGAKCVALQFSVAVG